jgi:hypothetical protein
VSAIGAARTRAGQNAGMKKVTALLLTVAFACSALAQVSAPGKYYVSVEKTDERLQPSPTGKSTNVLRKRQAVDVLEVKGQWARVTKFYDGNVEGVEGQVARWIAVKDLSPVRPADEVAGKGEPPIAKLLTQSDDFARYRKAFITASQSLVERKQCTEQDFKDVGGWSKSTNFAGKPVYFTYCGGMSKANRVYLNAATGEVFR